MMEINNTQVFNESYKTTKEQELKSVKKRALHVGVSLVSFKFLMILASTLGSMFLIYNGFYNENIETNFEGFEPVSYYLLTIFITLVSLGLPLLFLFIFSEEKPKDLFKFKLNNLTVPLIGLGLGGCIISNLVANSISSISQKLGYPMSSGQIYYNGHALIAVFMVITNCLLPAFFEEFIFRGLILGNLKKYGEFPALIISSVAFAFMHGTLLQVPFALMSGLVLGFVYLKSGSILPSVIVHFFNNFLSVISVILSTHLGKTFANSFYSLAFVAIALFWVFSLNKLKQKDIFIFDYSKDQRVKMGLFFKTYVLSFGSFLFLAIVAFNILQILVK